MGTHLDALFSPAGDDPRDDAGALARVPVGVAGVPIGVVGKASDYGAPVGFDPKSVEGVIVEVDGKPVKLGKQFSNAMRARVGLPPVTTGPARKVGSVPTPVASNEPGKLHSLFEKPAVVESGFTPLPATLEEVVPPPKYGVRFEYAGLGTMRAWYHDIISVPGFIILVFDTRCRYAARYFPPVTDEGDPQPFGLYVTGSDEAHLVCATGAEFSYGSCEFSVLVVDRSLPYSEAT